MMGVIAHGISEAAEWQISFIIFDAGRVVQSAGGLLEVCNNVNAL
jgi:hypothetical protein